MTVAEVREYARRTAVELVAAGVELEELEYTQRVSRQVEVRRGILQRKALVTVTDSNQRTLRGWPLWAVTMTVVEVHRDQPPEHYGYSEVEALWLAADGEIMHIDRVSGKWGTGQSSTGSDYVRSTQVATDAQIRLADTAFHSYLRGPSVPRKRNGNYKAGYWESTNYGRRVPPLAEGMRVSRALTDLRKKAGTHPKSPPGVASPSLKTAVTPSPARPSPAPVPAPVVVPAAKVPAANRAVASRGSRSMFSWLWIAPLAAVSGIALVLVVVDGLAGALNRSSAATGFALAGVQGQPIRWDPCAGPIGVQVNYGRLLPAYRQRAQDAVQQGIAAVNDASGLQLVYQGTTTARPAYARGANKRTDDNAITIGFLPAGTGLLIGASGSDSAAITATRPGNQQWRAITAAGIQIRSKADNYTQHVLWGLGRAVGLADVPASQGPGIMAGNPTDDTYSPSDLTGLATIGANQGCLK